MILVIDNYDSFVHNLARYINICGFEVTIIRNDAISIEQIKQLNPSKIVISPGPCTPDEAGISLALVEKFYTSIPILGVCLGHQVIGQVFGAKVVKAQEPMHGMASEVNHNKLGIFKNLPTPLRVGRYHSLIVDEVDGNSQLLITALSKSGEIMALEHKNFPVFGVQFHPESILTENGLNLISNFLMIN